MLTTERSIAWWSDKDKQLTSLPGAVDFIKQAIKLGVEVFYSSGRYQSVMKSTIATLLRLGFEGVDESRILLQPVSAYTQSKAERLDNIKKQGFTIVMTIGDQLEDLAPVQLNTSSHSYADRKEWVNETYHMFGGQWILFPNPLYGRWEWLLDKSYKGQTPEGKHTIRLTLLQAKIDKDNGPVFRRHMMQAALWQNFSGNYPALTHQAYNHARWRLEKIKNHSAQGLAIAVNVDGTVLNIGDELSLLNLKNNAQNRDKKLLKVDNALVPGVKGFLDQAKKLGFEIFYISNRPISSYGGKKGNIKQATIENLKKHGLPSVDDQHILFVEDCRTPLTSQDKKCCREAIEKGKANGKKYKITLFVGDKLDDFDLTEQGLNPRVSGTVDKIKLDFGSRYFLIPQLLSMPDIRRDHVDKSSDNNVLTSLTDEDLGKLRASQLEDWKGKPSGAILH